MSGYRQIESVESNKIWMMKAVAVLCVICAHCSTVGADVSILPFFIARYLEILGSLGVVVFFFLQGYLFKFMRVAILIRTKCVSLLLPWFFCGSIVYLYIGLRKGGLSVFSWIIWIVGDQTYLWFMSTTVMLILIAEVIIGSSKNLKIQKITFIVLLLLSICITLGCNHGIVRLHPYLNPFRWLWIFIAGYLLREHGFLAKVPSAMIGVVAFFAGAAVITFLGIRVNYWTDNWLMVSMVSLPLIGMIPVGTKLEQFFINTGKKSFSIYLLHMPLAGLVVNIGNQIPDSGVILVIIRPVIILLGTYYAILLLERIGEALNVRRLVQVLIGSR